MENSKNYLEEKLSAKEKSYLKRIVMTARNKYIQKNYKYINTENLELKDEILEEHSFEMETILKITNENVKTEIDFVNSFSNELLANAYKALSSKEKKVLFLLFNKQKRVNEIATEMYVTRETVWRIKERALKKLLKNILGGI